MFCFMSSVISQEQHTHSWQVECYNDLPKPVSRMGTRTGEAGRQQSLDSTGSTDTMTEAKRQKKTLTESG